MAEVYFRFLASNNKSIKITAKSAGVFAVQGEPASEMARKTMNAEGLSLNKFKSSPLNLLSVENATMLVVMTQNQIHQIEQLFPDYKDKLYLLLGFSGDKADLSDPFGGSEIVFRNCLAKMKPALQALLCELTQGYSVEVSKNGE